MIENYTLFATECIYGFCMIIRVNSYYFLEQDWQTGLCNGEVLRFHWGTDWISKQSFGFEGLIEKFPKIKNMVH
jgi:hypothetical protein